MNANQSVLFVGALLSFAFSLFSADVYHVEPPLPDQRLKPRVSTYKIVESIDGLMADKIVGYDTEGQRLFAYEYCTHTKRVVVKKSVKNVNCFMYLQLELLRRCTLDECPFDFMGAQEVVPEPITIKKKKKGDCVVQ